MKNKNLIVLSILATVLCSGMFITTVAAQEDQTNPTRAPAPSVPDAGLLIAPAPEDNSTSSDSDQIYYALDKNVTVPHDGAVPSAEDANLIATNTGAATDNNLAIAAIAVLSVVVAAAAVGVVYYRRSASKQQI
jgi:hypothetical protein